jgi:hypothetical protein
MSKHFDINRAHELYGELDAHDHLTSAIAALPAGQARHLAEQAKQSLHFITHVAEAREELRAHRASTTGALAAPKAKSKGKAK